MTPEEKSCAVCGRRIEWRRKWSRVWAEVRYCSDACRARRGGRERRVLLETAILEQLTERPRGASLCPSEVARTVAPTDWRAWMEPVREAARRLVDSGQVEVTQGGRVVDPSRARGPIRLRLRSSPARPERRLPPGDDQLLTGGRRSPGFPLPNVGTIP